MGIRRRVQGRRRARDGVLLICASALAIACGGASKAGGTPAEGQPADPSAAGAATWDFAYFYADSSDDGHVYGVSADAQSLTPIASGDAANRVGPVVFDQAEVYYATAAADSSGWTILVVPVDGSRAPEPVMTNASVTALALDDTSLYVLGGTETSGPSGVTSYTTSLVRTARDSRGVDAATLEKLAEDPGARGVELTVFGSDAYFSETLGDSSSPPDARVRRVGTTGGAPATVAESPNLTNFTVDGSGLYYLDTGGRSVDCGPKNPTIEYVPADGSATVPVATGLSVQGPLALQDGALYFSTRGQGCTGEPPSDLRKLASPSAGAETLVSGVTDPSDFYFSGQNLYFVYFADYRYGIQAPAVTPLSPR